MRTAGVDTREQHLVAGEAGGVYIYSKSDRMIRQVVGGGIAK